MRYQPFPSDFFVQNRKRLAQLLLPKSLAIFSSNDLYPKSADGLFPFHQDSDFFYLTGVNQEESLLLVCPEASDKIFQEVLFLRRTDEVLARWEGEKLTLEQARALTGIQSVYFLDECDRILNKLVFESENLYFNTNEHLRKNTPIVPRNERFLNECKQKFPLHHYHRLAPLMHSLRAIKSPIEIKYIQKALEITAEAFERVAVFLSDGVWEYELEAEIIHTFIRKKSEGFAYEPILGTGANSCILHYIKNKEQCKKDEIILMDFGARYGNYCADITRVLPVNGQFSKRQKQVYEAVLRVKKYAENLLKPGIFLAAYQNQVGDFMQNELLELGLISSSEATQNPLAYKKYFMHGTSHFLGIDVHDVGLFHEPLQENMVLTVEPGIYIPEENLGIRLEDDILIQNTKNINLSAFIPIEIEAIEALMQKKS